MLSYILTLFGRVYSSLLSKILPVLCCVSLGPVTISDLATTNKY